MHWKFLRRKMRFQFSKNDMVAMVGSVKLAGYSKRHLHSEYFFCLTWPSEWWWGHKYTQRPYRKRKTTTYTTKTQMLFFPAIWVSLRIWHYNHPFHSRPNFTASILRRFVYPINSNTMCVLYFFFSEKLRILIEFCQILLNKIWQKLRILIECEH